MTSRAPEAFAFASCVTKTIGDVTRLMTAGREVPTSARFELYGVDDPELSMTFEWNDLEVICRISGPVCTVKAMIRHEEAGPLIRQIIDNLN
jgi:ribonuclease PH